MKSALKATAILGSSSIISAAIALVSAKIWAVLIGPVGVGYIAGFQSLLGLSVMIAGFGIATAFVRIGAKAISDGNEKELTANWKAGFILVVFFSLISSLLLIIFSQKISTLVFGSPREAFQIIILTIPTTGNLLTNFFIGVVNAYHRVATLAKISIFNNLFNAFFLIGFIYFFRVQGIVFGLLAGLTFNCAFNYFLLRRNINFPQVSVSFSEIKQAAFSLIRFGFPYTASMVVGTGVQLALPLLILNKLSVEDAGFYRAAAGISTLSLSLVLTAMGQDYYPRLSSVSEDRTEIAKLVNQQQWISVIFLSPIFLGLLLLSPILIVLLYSKEFYESLSVFKWLVFGDFLKSIGWVLAFVILARNKSFLYFLTEAVGGIAAITAFSFGIYWYGIEGAGVGYFASYFIYAIFVFFVVRQEISFCYSRKNKLALGFTFLSIFIANILSLFASNYVLYSFLIVVTVAASISSALILIREIGTKNIVHKIKFWQRNI